ncbi:MAG: CRISPR-associated endonuclease Cas1 [Planctomycetia bacterium]
MGRSRIMGMLVFAIAGAFLVTPFFRFRFTLKATRDIHLPPYHGAVLYALICAAHRPRATQHALPQSFPAALMTDVPEECRSIIERGSLVAFGGTLLAADAAEPTALVQLLSQQLQQLGQQGKPRPRGLGGNFEFCGSADLVGGLEFPANPLQSVPASHLDREVQQLVNVEQLTLHLQSPVRIERPRKLHRGIQTCFDADYFDLHMLIRMLLKRMSSIGIDLRPDQTTPVIDNKTVQLLDADLHWLDLTYGGKTEKTLGGIVGSIRLQTSDPVVRAALVWGQYARLGKNTSFGFGRYRIAELGPEPFACDRAVPLLETAWRHHSLDSVSAKAQLDAGVLGHAIEEIRSGCYQPQPHATVSIGSGEKVRMLKIPSRRDRALQRLVLEGIGPGIDHFFEHSSFAWRKGLGRHRSAQAISKAWKQGFRYAVNADFDRFFDTIDHKVLERRLSCYVADPPTVALLMGWIRSAMGTADRGIPTGSPLSPLLGNLLLDGFDESIAATGNRLVRYGDDFLILCRDQHTADALSEFAMQQADQLLLTLNDQSPGVTDFQEPFRFLGFQFVKQERWERKGRAEPQRLEELGWYDAASSTALTETKLLRLPGESGEAARDPGLTAIVGPGATHLELRRDSLGCHYTGGRPATSIPLADLETLVVLGNLGLSASVVQELLAQQIHVILADDRGNAFAEIIGDYDLPHDVLAAQVNATQYLDHALELAKMLVTCKIHNYRRLAQSLGANESLVQRLLEAEERATRADSIEQLRGFEGSAAALWYGQFNGFLGREFRFEKRVAPAADDPVNVLLNIAHTLTYRLSILAIRTAGLCSSLGFLHTSTGRFAALATDLQESFRFLMDRAVIEATQELSASDFLRDVTARYPLMLKNEAQRKFQQILWKNLHREIRVTESQDESTSYLLHLQRQARQLRRHLLHPEIPFTGFRLP